MDDYSLPDRNFLLPGRGYIDCLGQVRVLNGNYLPINQHLAPAFLFPEDSVCAPLRYDASRLGTITGDVAYGTWEIRERIEAIVAVK